jgi:hypothetical protein
MPMTEQPARRPSVPASQQAIDQEHTRYTEAETLALLQASAGQSLSEMLARIPEPPSRLASGSPERPAVDTDDGKRQNVELERDSGKVYQLALLAGR